MRLNVRGGRAGAQAARRGGVLQLLRQHGGDLGERFLGRPFEAGTAAFGHEVKAEHQRTRRPA